MKRIGAETTVAFVLAAMCALPTSARAAGIAERVYTAERVKPVDSVLSVQVGDEAPDFILPAIGGGNVRLGAFRGKQPVVLSFVPAAWSPVCSEQWPVYESARAFFEKHNAMLLGVTVDGLHTLRAWARALGGLWFPVLSDFWPHGETAKRYGVLRPDGVAERALFIIDKHGIIRYIDVQDINRQPDLGVLVKELERLDSGISAQ